MNQSQFPGQSHFHRAVEETPFHRRTAALNRNNDWSRWAGYTVVACYDTVETEYFAIRNAATLLDISPLIKYKISGPDAQAYLNRLMTSNVARLADNRVSYCLWCDDAGKVMDDGTLFCMAPDDYRLCCQERHLPWLLDNALGFDVQVEDITERVAALALQGPTSAAVLRRLGIEGVDLLGPFGHFQVAFGDAQLLISRTGYTGDLGYELWTDPTMAEELWDRIMAAGAPLGLRPIGTRALDIARLEAGFIAANQDFVPAQQALRRNRARSPFELGLGRLVDFHKGHFNGRRALLAEKENGARHCLVKLDIEGNKVATGALVYHGRRREVGHITSAHWSPVCKANMALASLRLPYGQKIVDDLWVEIYVLKELKWDKVKARCTLSPHAFFRHPRRNAMPPGDF